MSERTHCTGRALRVPRDRTKRRGKNFLAPEVMISKRPAEAAGRAVLAHWEGDLIIEPNKSAIAALVECTTRFRNFLTVDALTTSSHST